MADKYVAARRLPRHGEVSGLREAGLRAFAILANSIVVDESDIATLNIAKGTLSKLAATLSSIPPGGLFASWAPRRESPTTPIRLDPSAASASSTKKSDTNAFAPGKALEDGASAWTSTRTKSCNWAVDFERAVPLARVNLELRLSALPETLEIEYTENDDKTDWKPVTKKLTGKDVKAVISIPVKDVKARHVRVTFTNYAASPHPNPNTDEAFAIIKAQFFSCVLASEFSSGGDILSNVSEWLLKVHAAASGINKSTADNAAKELSNEIQATAFKCMVALATASASARDVLKVCSQVIEHPECRATPETTAALKQLIEAIRQQIVQVRQEIDEHEYYGTATARTTLGAAWGPIDAVFDPKECSTGVTITNDGKTIKSDNGNYNHCLVNLGSDKGFTEGKASWEFKLVEDTDSQCSCFGASVKPVTSSDYNNSPSFFMYRSYNGYRYARGTNTHSTSDTRVFKGDTIKFEVDFDEADGVIRCWIKGQERGIVFTGVKGKEIWPAVAFYGSNRTVDLLSVEGPTRKQATTKTAASAVTNSHIGEKESVFLADLPEIHAVSAGTFGRNGDLGIGAAGAKAKVNGTAVAHSISTHPPSGRWRGSEVEDATRAEKIDFSGCASTEAKRELVLERALEESKHRYANTGTAVYLLDRKFESFSGSVALDDSVTAEMRAGSDASPVFFEIYGDNELLWRSQAFHAAKTRAQSFKVSMLNVTVLRLVTRCVAANTGAWVVWVDPVLATSTEWTQYGWRHDRDVFTHQIFNIPRHKPLPLPPLDEHAFAAEGASMRFACGQIGTYLSILATEHLRKMRGQQALKGNVADTEAPYVIQLDRAMVDELAGLISRTLRTIADKGADEQRALVEVLTGMVRLATVNLRHLLTSSLSPADVKLGEFKKRRGKEAKKEDPVVEISPSVSQLFGEISELAEWGGSSAGSKLLAGTPSSAVNARSILSTTQLQDAVWDFIDLTRALLPSIADSQTEFFSRIVNAPGTVEIQLVWPCEEYHDDSSLLQLEAVVLQLQLHAKMRGWRYRLLGRWPAKVFILLEIPAAPGVSKFLTSELDEIMDSLDLDTWWHGLSGGDGLPVKLERAATWNRADRLKYEPGFGVLRVYPQFACSFDEVVSALEAFLPTETSA